LRLSEEVPGEGDPELLDRALQPIRSEGVGRVLHRVGRDHARVVALRIRGGEVAFQGDADRQVVDPMWCLAAHDLDEADRLLAVGVRADLDHEAAPTGEGALANRSRAIATTSRNARRISASRSASRAASRTGTSSGRERPFTKTQKRKPNRL